jgi:hypothetical protein
MPEAAVSQATRSDTALYLLDSILQHPDSLEAGLRLLGMDAVPGRDAYLAWGVDRQGRNVALYVGSGGLERRALETSLTPVARVLSGSTSTAAVPGRRILAVASRFSDDLKRGPPTLLDGWAMDLFVWNTEAAETIGRPEPGPAQLTSEEIESLVGSPTSTPTRSRA